MAISLEVRIIILLVLFGAIVWHRVGLYFEERKQREALHQWIKDNGLLEYEASLRKFGVQTPKKFANMDVSKFVTYHSSWWGVFTSQTHKERLGTAVVKMKEQLELLNWLEDKGLGHLYSQFMSHGLVSKGLVLERIDLKTLSSIMMNDISNIDKVLTLLKSDEAVDTFSESESGVFSFVTTPLLLGIRAVWWLVLLTVKLILFSVAVIASLCIVYCLGRRIKWAHERHVYQNMPGQRDNYLVLRAALSLVSLLFVNLHPRRLLTFLSDIFGNSLDPRSCTVQWLWENPEVVGKTMTFFVKFYRRNRLSYALKEDDPVKVEITYKHTLVSYSMEQSGSNVLKITFTVREAGPYSIAVMVMGKNIRGSPFKKTFLPGPIDPSKCTILESASMLVVQKGIYHPLTVEAKDKYGNICEITDQDIDSYDVKVKKIGYRDAVDPELVILPDSLDRKNVLHVKLEEEGCFDAVVSYERTMLENGQLTIISLNEKEADEVQKNLSRQLWNVWYEAYILPSEANPSQTSSNPASSRSSDHRHSTMEISCSEINRKKRKVYCYISRRHLTLKEFYMKFIPRRLFTFLVRPRTKLVLCQEDDRYDHPVFTVDDGAQQPISIMCKERNVLVATFSRLLLKNIGGSESFADKQIHFYQELLAYHSRKTTTDVKLKIKRSNILESSYQACKSLMTSDWCRPLMIEFANEEALDWGGPRREWFELLCIALFAHENKFFRRFNKDDPQAMVHPNPRRPDNQKLKYYEFAGRIVGKCMYESAQGSTRRQNVKARFTRSFLAQLLGLRVHYKYFESDDKELYRSKIQYIKDNDPEDLGIVFAEEEYNEQGKLERNVELKPGGAQIPVTQDNKMEYLELLAQWRLATSVSREIEAFQKGLNEIVPDNLLSIFDEYELELLMCGTGNISVSDLKKNCNRAGFGRSYGKVVDWFWTIIGSFTQEELARLVQFVTGSSQLPPGGFAELSPKFQISSSPTRDSLPTAHTCFNQLCLPDYSSCEELQRCLLLAINEGSEGFGMV